MSPKEQTVPDELSVTTSSNESSDGLGLPDSTESLEGTNNQALEAINDSAGDEINNSTPGDTASTPDKDSVISAVTPESERYHKEQSALDAAIPQPKRTTIYSGSNKFLGKLSRHKIISLSAGAFGLILCASILVVANMDLKKHGDKTAQSQQKPTSISSRDLSDIDSTEKLSSKASKIAINGPLEVNNRFVVAPSTRPDTAKAGQIYFDRATKTFAYFDGKTYQTISTQSSLGATLSQSQDALGGQLTASINTQRSRIDDVVRSLQSAVGDISLNPGSGVSISGLLISNTGVLSLQGKNGVLVLKAGSGIAINDLQISNTGVTRLQGTANQILVSAETGGVAISLPQDINTTSTPVFTGLTLASALAVSSGGTGSAASSFFLNGVVYYDGGKLVSTPSAYAKNLCLVSTDGAPEFASCDSALAAVVKTINSLTGNISISNSVTDANTKTISIRDADTLGSGLVTTTSQTFAGLKTFNAGINIRNGQAIGSDGAITIQTAANRDLVLSTSGYGKLVFSGLDCSTSGNGGKLTVDVNGAVQCAEDIGGDGVGMVSIASSDASITIDNTDGANPKIAVSLVAGGGLETTSSGVGLIGSCLDNQILKYDATTSAWKCGQDADTTDGTCSSCVALQSSTPGVAQSGNINITGALLSGSADIAGNFKTRGSALLKNAADSEAALLIQNSIGSSLFTADTKHMNMTIGSLTSPTIPSIGNLPVSALSTVSTGGLYSQPYSVAINGNYAYVAVNANNTFLVVNISDPANPVVVQTVSGGLNGNPVAVASAGNYLYMINGSSKNKMTIWNITDPSLPTTTGSVSIVNSAEAIAVSGNYVYIPNSGNGTFQVIDVSNPASPALVANPLIGSGSSPSSIAIYGSYAYVTDLMKNRLEIFDISIPTSPTKVGGSATNTYPQSVATDGQYAYVVNQGAGTMQIFDISNPASPSLRSTTGTAAYPYSIVVADGRAILVSYTTNSMQMFDVSDPSNPAQVGANAPTDNHPYYMTMSGAYAYVIAKDAGTMQIFNLGSSTTLTVNGSTVMTGSLTATGATLSGTLATNIIKANTAQLSMKVEAPSYDTASATDLKLGQTNATGIALYQNTTLATGKTLSVQGDTFIKANSASAFSVQNSSSQKLLNADTSNMQVSIGVIGGGGSDGVSMPSSPAGTASVDTLPRGLAVSGNYAYTANLINGVQVFDISNPASPTAVGSVSVGGSASNIATSGNYAYVQVGGNKIQILDISNPASPVAKGSITTNQPGTIWGVGAYGTTIVVSYITSTDKYVYLEYINASDPAVPTFVKEGFLGYSGSKAHLSVDGDFAYVAIAGSPTSFSALKAINIPTTLSGTFSYKNFSLSSTYGVDPRGVAAHNSYFYVAFSDSQKLQAFDFTNPAVAPVAKGSVALAAQYPNAIAVSNDGKYAYTVDNLNNFLQVFDITDINNPSSLGTISTGSANSQAYAVASAGKVVYVINSNASNLVIFNLESSSGIALNQDTKLASGVKLTAQGDTLVKTSSLNAFRVQDASGTNVLAVDTVSGTVVASIAFGVGGNTGISTTCTASQTLNNITVTGGIITGGTCTANASDLAEQYGSSQGLVAGEIVATASGDYRSVERSSATNQSNLIGIVSTKPFRVLGDNQAGYPIALAGRVPTKVNLEGGAIHKGDKITSSSTPGVGMKANHAGMIVGTALEDYDGTGDEVVEVLVHTSYYNPNPLQGSTSGNLSGLNVSGAATLNTLTVNGIAVFETNIVIGGHVITNGNTPIANILPAAGADSGTCTVTGNDTSGSIILTSGTTNLSSGAVCRLVFTKPFATTPHPVVSSTDMVSFAVGGYVSADPSSLTLRFYNTPEPQRAYHFNYLNIQ